MASIAAALPPATTLCAMLLAATSARADGVAVVLHGSYVERVQTGGSWIEAHDLAPGSSTGGVQHLDTGGFAIGSADDRNLATYFARTSVGTGWLVDLGDWQDQNGNGHDFFLFEVGGDDVVLVAARFLDGSYGQDVGIAGWTSTGYRPLTGPNAGQTVFALAFKHTQLKDAGGNPLPAGMHLAGIRIRSVSLDGAAFLAHRLDPSAGVDGDGSVSLSGSPRVGQLVELVYSGPWASETDLAPNPFLDYRLDVILDGPDTTTLRVPGFFDADGAGGEMGVVWKVRLRLPQAGSWTATASFRQGPGVAVSLDPGAGSPGLLDGATITFPVGPLDPGAPGFAGRGPLTYVGRHYQRFADGSWYLKVGTNSPENLLGYRGFDATAKMPGGQGSLHDYGPHVGDWVSGDPKFLGRDHGLDGKGIIGALNYLSSVGVNSVHAMPMNLGGDGQDAHPFLGMESDDFSKTHYDTGRLAQWQAVFQHSVGLGIGWQLSLAETEWQNEKWLDGGGFGPQRKLFFRELIARFAHHPVIHWTLSEENDFSIDRLRQFADYIQALDPQDHPIGVHNHVGDLSVYDPMQGDPRFTASALQFDPDQAGTLVETLRADSAAAGRPWLVGAVEHTPWNEGVTDSNHDELRKRILYDVLFSGGQVEWYAGWHPLPLGGDVSLEDFRTRHAMWVDSKRALKVLGDLPFWRMEPADELLTGESSKFGGGEVLARTGEAYAVYLPQAKSTGKLDLSATVGPLEQRWYDPRKGKYSGSAKTVTAGGSLSLGKPPKSSSEDWVVVLTRPPTLEADVDSISVSSGGTQTLVFDGGSSLAGRAYLLIGSLSGTSPGFKVGDLCIPINFDRYTRWTMTAANGSILKNTSGVVPGSGQVTMWFELQPGGMSSLVGTTLNHALVTLTPIDFASNAVALELTP